MSDQGYPGQDHPGQDHPGQGDIPGYGQQPYEQPTQPAYEPPPSYEPPPPTYEAPQPPPPPFGQQPPPAYEPPQPPPYTPPPPQQPAYTPPPQQPPYEQPAQPQFGQPYYGDPQYPTTQFPAGQYPTGQYPTESYQYPAGAVPPQYPGTPATGTGAGNRRGRWLSLAVGVLVALGILGYFLLSGNNASASTPTKAVSALLDAGKSGDTSAAKKALCKADANDAVIASLRTSGRIKSYSIGAVHNEDSTHAVVSARLTTTISPTPADVAFQVVKEGGTWKACPDRSSIVGVPNGGPSGFPSAQSSIPVVPVPSISIPVPSISVPNFPVPSGVPSTTINPCGFATTLEQSAITFVGLAELGQTSYAKACVWNGQVTTSDIEKLRAKTSSDYFSPAGSSGPVVSFASIDGTKHLQVTMAKEADGRYYVTKVQLG
jgi:hypothetical protein